jgi:hypothetical protein
LRRKRRKGKEKKGKENGRRGGKETHSVGGTDVNEAGPDIARVAESLCSYGASVERWKEWKERTDIEESEGGGALDRRLSEDLTRPREDVDDSGVTHRRHEHDGDVTSRSIHRRDGDDVGGGADKQRQSDMPGALTLLVAVVAGEDGSDDGEDPGWGGEAVGDRSTERRKRSARTQNREGEDVRVAE